MGQRLVASLSRTLRCVCMSMDVYISGRRHATQPQSDIPQHVRTAQNPKQQRADAREEARGQRGLRLHRGARAVPHGLPRQEEEGPSWVGRFHLVFCVCMVGVYICMYTFKHIGLTLCGFVLFGQAVKMYRAMLHWRKEHGVGACMCPYIRIHTYIHIHSIRL